MVNPNQQPMSPDWRPLELTSEYLCPACRHGQLEAMVLMDTFACDFCRHIFEANLEEQTLHIVDSSEPFGWRWLGQRWQPIHQQDGIAVALGATAVLLLVLPTGLVAGSAYLFPPLEGSYGASIPSLWTIATLVAHSVIVLWLLAERYQLSVYVAAKAWLRRWRERI